MNESVKSGCLMSKLRSRLAEQNGRLRRVFSDFSKLWQATGEFWRDEQRSRYEKQHLAMIGPSLQRLSSMLTQLTDSVSDAEKELSDEKCD